MTEDIEEVEGEIFHVIPVDDLIEHDSYEGAWDSCICGPGVEYVGPGWLILHHSLDGRENYE